MDWWIIGLLKCAHIAFNNPAIHLSINPIIPWLANDDTISNPVAGRGARKLLHGHERDCRAHAALGAHAAWRAGWRVFHHRRDDGDARDGEQHRTAIEFARQPDLHDPQMAGDL